MSSSSWCLRSFEAHGSGTFKCTFSSVTRCNRNGHAFPILKYDNDLEKKKKLEQKGANRKLFLTWELEIVQIVLHFS